MVRRLAWLFALAGALVIVALTAALLSSETRIRIPAITALVTFVAVVLSYLGGIEAGLALNDRGSDAATRAITLSLSLLPSAAAWGVLWLPSTQWQLGAAIAMFVFTWAADLWLARRGLVPSWFVDLRTAATALVAITLAVALYLL
jgi:hypothetical protein